MDPFSSVLGPSSFCFLRPASLAERTFRFSSSFPRSLPPSLDDSDRYSPESPRSQRRSYLSHRSSSFRSSSTHTRGQSSLADGASCRAHSSRSPSPSPLSPGGPSSLHTTPALATSPVDRYPTQPPPPPMMKHLLARVGLSYLQCAVGGQHKPNQKSHVYTFADIQMTSVDSYTSEQMKRQVVRLVKYSEDDGPAPNDNLAFPGALPIHFGRRHWKASSLLCHAPSRPPPHSLIHFLPVSSSRRFKPTTTTSLRKQMAYAICCTSLELAYSSSTGLLLQRTSITALHLSFLRSSLGSSVQTDLSGSTE